MEDRWDMPQPPIDIPMPGTARRFETGSPNFAGVFALAEATRIYRELGPKVIEERVLRLNTILSERLLDAGIAVLGPFRDDSRSGILYARIPDLERVSASLAANKVRVNLGHGMARISTHYFNTEEDIDRLVSAFR
jgi:selenocysteine lyase/cysteine desulfurase